jgi:uncharacterized protein
MVHVTRRRFLAGAGVGAAALSLSGYATAYETGSVLTLAKYAPPNWPEDLELDIAVIADIHACYPWMSEERVGDIVDLANAQKPDLTVLLGDYVCTHRLVSGYVPPGAWAEQLARLEAPLGVYAILGNHDWLSAAIPTEPPDNSRSVRRALAEAGVPLLENQSVRLSQRGRSFWLIGLGDLLAPVPSPRHGHGAADLPAAMRTIDDDSPAILLVHEPYFFPRVPDWIALTLAGPHARRPDQSSDHRPAGRSPQAPLGEIHLWRIRAERAANDRFGRTRNVARAGARSPPTRSGDGQARRD